MKIYSSLMGDDLVKDVLHSPYPEGDCTGQELWAVTGFVSPAAILYALYQRDATPQKGKGNSWGDLNAFEPNGTTPKIHLLVGMARDGAISTRTHELFKEWVKSSRGYLDIQIPASLLWCIPSSTLGRRTAPSILPTLARLTFQRMGSISVVTLQGVNRRTFLCRCRWSTQRTTSTHFSMLR